MDPNNNSEDQKNQNNQESQNSLNSLVEAIRSLLQGRQTEQGGNNGAGVSEEEIAWALNVKSVEAAKVTEKAAEIQNSLSGYNHVAAENNKRQDVFGKALLGDQSAKVMEGSWEPSSDGFYFWSSDSAAMTGESSHNKLMHDPTGKAAEIYVHSNNRNDDVVASVSPNHRGVDHDDWLRTNGYDYYDEKEEKMKSGPNGAFDNRGAMQQRDNLGQSKHSAAFHYKKLHGLDAYDDMAKANGLPPAPDYEREFLNKYGEEEFIKFIGSMDSLANSFAGFTLTPEQEQALVQNMATEEVRNSGRKTRPGAWGGNNRGNDFERADKILKASGLDQADQDSLIAGIDAGSAAGYVESNRPDSSSAIPGGMDFRGRSRSQNPFGATRSENEDMAANFQNNLQSSTTVLSGQTNAITTGKWQESDGWYYVSSATGQLMHDPTGKARHGRPNEDVPNTTEWAKKHGFGYFDNNGRLVQATNPADQNEVAAAHNKAYWDEMDGRSMVIPTSDRGGGMDSLSHNLGHMNKIIASSVSAGQSGQSNPVALPGDGNMYVAPVASPSSSSASAGQSNPTNNQNNGAFESQVASAAAQVNFDMSDFHKQMDALNKEIAAKNKADKEFQASKAQAANSGSGGSNSVVSPVTPSAPKAKPLDKAQAKTNAKAAGQLVDSAMSATANAVTQIAKSTAKAAAASDVSKSSMPVPPVTPTKVKTKGPIPL